MTLPSGWATATRSYDDQGFPASTSAPEAPPVAGQQQNSKVGSKTAASNGAGPSAGVASRGQWLLLTTAPLLMMFLAGVVVI